MHTSSSRRIAAVFAAGLFTLTACGQSEAQDEAVKLAADTEKVASGAAGYVGDPWERRAREEYLKRMQAPDGWQHHAIEQHEQRLAEEKAKRCD